MLKLSGIVKNFDKIQALKGIDLEIRKGEFFGLLGPNGAGKTTLLNIIIGFLRPDEGHIEIDNETLVFDNSNVKKRFGYIPQEIALFQELSAYSNLKIFGQLYGVSGNLLEEEIEDVLELVGLKGRERSVVKNFSGGMKRRLNIACGILHNPEIILCDEPTVGVDPQSRNAIFDLLQKLNSEGKTIIYTTHYMEEAERLCNKIAIIDFGKIVAQGNLEEIISILPKRKTIEIVKNDSTIPKKELLETIGIINENEYSFEIVPSEKFRRNVEIFTKLSEFNIPDEFVEIKKATLEDVFLYLTGRKFRD